MILSTTTTKTDDSTFPTYHHTHFPSNCSENKILWPMKQALDVSVLHRSIAHEVMVQDHLKRKVCRGGTSIVHV